MSKTDCWVCGNEIDVQVDAWWRYSWHEEPSKKEVEKAIEDPDFGDWFRENKVVCQLCHDDLQEAIQEVLNDV